MRMPEVIRRRLYDWHHCRTSPPGRRGHPVARALVPHDGDFSAHSARCPACQMPTSHLWNPRNVFKRTILGGVHDHTILPTQFNSHLMWPSPNWRSFPYRLSCATMGRV
jgi:hypothetical protein